MSNLTTPLAILIGAVLIAGAIIVSGGVYEFESVNPAAVNRYNKFTGSIYFCMEGDPCEPFEPAEATEMQEGVNLLEGFKFDKSMPTDAPEGFTEVPDKSKLQTEAEPEQESEQTNAAELINRSMEMLTLNQQINQSLQAYSKSKAPKSKFISSRTREFKYASYMRDWVQQVERVGELNYPDSARRQHLSGKLIVQVALHPDGSVREITVRKPSGHKILDDAVVRIVELAAPFAPFPDDIKKEIGILYITRTWVFTSGNRLKSH